MKTTTFMFRSAAALLIPVFSGTVSSAQSKIKDGTVTSSSTLPNANAILDLESNHKGFLLPRIGLSSTTSASPLTAHVRGMTVYDTATAGDVTPGYYYNDGAKWVRIADAAAADLSKDAWADDNSNTQVKLGAQSDGLTLRPDSAAFVVKDNGNTGIGLTNPAGILDIKGKMYVNNVPTLFNAGALNSTDFDGSLFLGDGGQALVPGGALNTGIGMSALPANTSGYQNTAVGHSSMAANTEGAYNVALGFQSLQSNLTGNGHVAVGSGALGSNTGGEGNTALGYAALYRNAASYNTGVGYTTLYNNTTGEQNTAVGTMGLYENTTGYSNTGVGYNVLQASTTGYQNTGVGSGVLTANTTGAGNTAMGTGTLASNTTGGNNTAVGYNTGLGIVSGANNTILGANVSGLAAALSNNIVIADGAGNQRIRVLNDGKTGIGTTAPANQLHVVSSSNPLRLDGLQAGSSTDSILTVSSGVVRKVNANAVVGLLIGSATIQGSTSLALSAATAATDIPGCSFSITPTVNARIVITVTALPLPNTVGSSVQGSVDLLENGTKIASQYYSATDGSSLNRLGNFTTVSRAVDLTAGTAYTFKLQAKSWANTSLFNNDPVSGPTTYSGAASTDANSQKSQISYLLYTR
ncbi:MAG: hypothetical protein JNL13_01685 [Chitinophagaceae bacterium]|nr:hypothetical protein [Chitinophagaceae bacterium]